jgi:hypothetical protein
VRFRRRRPRPETRQRHRQGRLPLRVGRAARKSPGNRCRRLHSKPRLGAKPARKTASDGRNSLKSPAGDCTRRAIFNFSTCGLARSVRAGASHQHSRRSAVASHALRATIGVARNARTSRARHLPARVAFLSDGGVHKPWERCNSLHSRDAAVRDALKFLALNLAVFCLATRAPLSVG